jgi:serine/threonine protein kinase
VQEIQTTLPIGSVVGGRYRVEKLLGKGGFGAVYQVKDQRVQQNIFALKEVIDPNRKERKRFVFEADLLRRLDHPALPRVYHVFEDDKNDRAYMLMDYVEGSNLELLRHRQPDKRFSVELMLGIMGPIMDAVSYLHNQKPPIIHRDIKPSNIIVPESGNEAVLVDFGIAKEFDPDSTTTAVRHASPGYAAPEQYGVGTNTRTDIYGLGATIYTLLTGVVPADAFYRTTQLGSKGTDPLTPIQHYVTDVPQYIADAIYRAMALDINDRFPTVHDFWQALNAQPQAFPSPMPLVIPGPTAAQSRPAIVNTPIPRFDNTTTFAVQRSPETRRRLGLLLLLLLALLAGITAAALLLPAMLGHQRAQTPITPKATVAHKPTLTPTPRLTPSPGLTPSPIATAPPSPPPAPVRYPNLAGAYNGTIIDNLGPIRGSMSLSIQQQQGNISGNFTVSGGLVGSGPFRGYVTNKGYIQFIVQSTGVNPLFFYGLVQANGVLSGSYCSLDSTGRCNANAGGYGTWSVLRETPGS